MYKITAFGNPLLDTIITLKDDTLLKKYNLKADGQKEVSQLEMQSLREDIKGINKTVTAGGCAQNTLKVMQWLLHKQGSATIFGAIGDDKEGVILKDFLKKEGVKTNYIVQNGYSTGITVALVSQKSRSLVACLGAAENISMDDIKVHEDLLTHIENSDLIYMEGFFITKRDPVAHYIVELCKIHKKIFAFNISGEYLCTEPSMKYVIEQSDIIFGNRKEFEILCSVMEQNTVEDVVLELGRNGKIVIVTNGSQPVIYVGNENKELNLTSPPVVNESEIVDTTGAGDSFVAGFLVGYLHKQSLKICTEIGCYAAQEIIKRMGCTVPDYKPCFTIL